MLVGARTFEDASDWADGHRLPPHLWRWYSYVGLVGDLVSSGHTWTFVRVEGYELHPMYNELESDRVKVEAKVKS